jgi:hypothetical protein
VEHELAPDEGGNAGNDGWIRCSSGSSAGCHLTRPIVDLLTTAGFEITELDLFYENGAPKAMGADSLGIARAPLS